MDALSSNLIAALADMSPLARTKIRATLEDTSQEVTWNNWTQVFNMHDAEAKEQKACGCLMLDGYFREHPPAFVLIDGDYKPYWITVDPDWETTLADFYEMYDNEDEDINAAERVGATATAYDQYVKHSKRLLVKRVRGVEVLRTPARRDLIKLLDQAEALAVQRA